MRLYQRLDVFLPLLGITIIARFISGSSQNLASPGGNRMDTHAFFFP